MDGNGHAGPFRGPGPGGRELPELAKASAEVVAIFSFKGSQAGVEQLAFRHDDDVEAWRDLVATEDLSNQSFSSISLNRAADLPGRRDPEQARAGCSPRSTNSVR